MAALAPDKFATRLGDTQQQQQPSPADNESAATLAAGGGVDGRGGHGGAVAMTPTAEPRRGKPTFASALVEEDSLNGDDGGDDGCLLYRYFPAVCVFSAR
jgi:hypothetical protein